MSENQKPPGKTELFNLAEERKKRQGLEKKPRRPGAVRILKPKAPPEPPDPKKEAELDVIRRRILVRWNIDLQFPKGMENSGKAISETRFEFVRLLEQELEQLDPELIKKLMGHKIPVGIHQMDNHLVGKIDIYRGRHRTSFWKFFALKDPGDFGKEIAKFFTHNKR